MAQPTIQPTTRRSTRRRNLSPYEAFLARGRATTPRFAYRDGDDVDRWRSAALPEVLATLGRLPEPVDPDPELLAEFEYRGILDAALDDRRRGRTVRDRRDQPSARYRSPVAATQGCCAGTVTAASARTP